MECIVPGQEEPLQGTRLKGQEIAPFPPGLGSREVLNWVRKIPLWVRVPENSAELQLSGNFLGKSAVSSAVAGTTARRPWNLPGQRSCRTGTEEGRDRGCTRWGCSEGLGFQNYVVNTFRLPIRLRSYEVGFNRDFFYLLWLSEYFQKIIS